MVDLSIVILNYKSKGLTLNCIRSIKEADFGTFKNEIIVVDNNSGDSIREILAWQYPDIKFIQNKENLGMGEGNNAGIKKASGKYIVVMNPDTIALYDTFKILFNFMEENKEVGIVGPLQYNPNKTIQNSCYKFPSILIPVYRRTPIGKMKFARKKVDEYLMKDFNHKSISEVDWVLGSFLFIRSSALEKTGLFDKRFFMYFEDTDLCKRFWKKNFKVAYNPEAKIIHNHTRQSAQDPWYKFFTNRAARCHVISWIKYFIKWGV